VIQDINACIRDIVSALGCSDEAISKFLKSFMQDELFEICRRNVSIFFFYVSAVEKNF